MHIEKKTINFLCLKSDDFFFGGGENIYDRDWQKCSSIIRHANLSEYKFNIYISPRFWLGPPLLESCQPSHTRILQAYFINIICPIFVVEKIRNLTCRLEYRVSYTELMRMKG